MDEFLPLLVIAVVIVINAIQQARKKKLQEEEEAQNTFPPVTVPNPIQERRTQTYTSSAAMKKEIHSQPSSATPAKEDPKRKNRERRIHLSSQKQNAELHVQDEENTYAINDAEEARRAIIYSEIINRKY